MFNLVLQGREQINADHQVKILLEVMIYSAAQL